MITKNARGELPNLPRYTSYPTAPYFTESAAGKAWKTLIAGISPEEPVSVYVHIPFCDRLCWFCGCHTKQTQKYEPIARYVNVLIQDIRRFKNECRFKPKLGFLHFGGGSPSLLRAEDARKINSALQTSFEYTTNAEVSIEIDPSDLKEGTLSAFEALNMNRASIGVQDFDLRVQKAINRLQSFAETSELVSSLREIGISSVNIDALFGLPHQTVETIEKTAAQIVSMSPDRIALFGYAHVPSIKKHQRMIDENTLPDDAARILQSEAARAVFLQNGYVPIGIDHFAKPKDSLAVASRNGCLRRNFQGYTIDQCRTLLGFGASAISRSEDAYVQNIVATGNYQVAVIENENVAERGFVLEQDDKIRAFMIEQLMCNFSLDTSLLERKYGNIANEYIHEVVKVGKQFDGELCEFKNGTLTMLPGKQQLVRIVAASFDAYLGEGNAVYSKAV